MNKTNDKSTKEVESMVRKAETLKSLKELNLSKEIVAYIKRNRKSLEDIIYVGRMTVRDPLFKGGDIKKYRVEIANALDKAGFIRHDVTWEREIFIYLIYNALCTGPYRYTYYSDNFNYEEFILPEEYEKLEKLAKEILTPEEFEYATKGGWRFAGIKKRKLENSMKKRLLAYANKTGYQLPKISHPNKEDGKKIIDEILSLINTLKYIEKLKNSTHFIIAELCSNLDHIHDENYGGYAYDAQYRAYKLSEYLSELPEIIPRSCCKEIITLEQELLERLELLSKLPFLEVQLAEDFLKHR